MAYFSQQLINAITLGAIYGLIAIGYTMVYGIIGMINFAHGEVFMIGAFISLIGFMICAACSASARRRSPSCWCCCRHGLHRRLWLDDRAHSPIGRCAARSAGAADLGDRRVDPAAELRAAGPGRAPKPAGRSSQGGFTLFSADGFDVRVTWLQIIIVVVTVALMAGFSWLIAATPLGRQQRACEQDMKMAALLGVDVDRTISLTFVMGAALAAVAGMMFLMYYGVVDFFIGFLAGIKAFTAAVLGGIGSLPGAMLGGLLIGLIEVFWAGYFSSEYKDVAVFAILVLVLIFRPTGLLGKPEIEKV